MDFNEYIKLAVRTESRINPYTGIAFSRQQRVFHAAMGLVTEAAELIDVYKKHIYYGKDLDRVNTKEEIGDICWYLALAYDAWGIKPVACVQGETAGTLYQISLMVQSSAICLGFTEEKSIFDKQLADILGSIIVICKTEGFVLDEILETNIAKLRARYPGKFNSNKALNRDLKTERTILER